jgi:septal ring factor EnvC (AmiA/AmiB activator)
MAVTSQAGQLVNNIIEDQTTIGARLTEVDARLKRVRLRSIARGRAYVRMVRSGLLPAAAGFDSLIEHASRVERLKRAIDRDLALQSELLDLKAKLLKKISELDERLSAMQAERQLMEQNRVALESARDRALAFESAFSGSPSAHTTIYGAGLGPANPLPSVSGFAALKGQLPFPLTGRTELRPAKRRAASGPALEMLAPAGSVVRAVFPGTVAFADEYADYGKTIIVDHRDGYFTVSANLGSINVKVGEDVGSGGQLATLGGAGSSALYFEIRQGTDTLDPAAWFGI